MVWRDKRYSQSVQPKGITNPEGKTLTLRPDEFWDAYTFDAQVNIYIHTCLTTRDERGYEKHETHLRTDRNGEWENLVSDNRPLRSIAVSDNAERTIWGSDGGCYLAFLRDGKWIEVASLHPVLEAGGPGTNMDPMRERYGENGMSLAVIDDADGYVNVRSNPSTNAPVIAMIFENVTFMYETIPDNHVWVKVLLPSGTKGYLSSSRLKPLKEKPIII